MCCVAVVKSPTSERQPALINSFLTNDAIWHHEIFSFMRLVGLPANMAGHSCPFGINGQASELAGPPFQSFKPIFQVAISRGT